VVLATKVGLEKGKSRFAPLVSFLVPARQAISPFHVIVDFLPRQELLQRNTKSSKKQWLSLKFLFNDDGRLGWGMFLVRGKHSWIRFEENQKPERAKIM